MYVTVVHNRCASCKICIIIIIIIIIIILFESGNMPINIQTRDMQTDR